MAGSSQTGDGETALFTPIGIDVVANDTDANGNLDPTSVAIAANPANGGVVNNGDGTVTYTPNLGFFGTDGFTYRINDSQGAISNVATVTVGVNAAPTADAGPDANDVTGQLVTLDGSASSDPNGDMITYSWRFLSVPPASALGDADIVNPASPAPMFTPDVDGAYELELTVADPGALSDTDTDQVMVKANAAPVAVANAFDVDEDTPLTVPAPGVLTNDTDANNDPLTAVLVSGPTNAQAFTPNPDGSFDYTPNADFTGTDSFTYKANDGSADSNPADRDHHRHRRQRCAGGRER